MDIVLTGLAASIGVGSLVFHIYANSLAELMDVIPIWTFVALYVGTVIHRLNQANPWKTLRIILIVAGCVGLSLWLTADDITTQGTDGADRFNGSLQYLTPLLALWAFALLTLIRAHPSRRLVTAAALSFTISLGFRTIDLTTCEATGFGTHFMWHILNGAMILALLLALIRHLPAKASLHQA
jgi:hypothetical protein